MSLWFFLFFLIILNRLFSYTILYIMSDWTKEPEEKIKLVKLAFIMYYGSMIAVWCYLNSLHYVY